MDSMQIVPRLIQKFVPTSYQLSLIINRIERSFGGIVTVIGSAQPNHNIISLHSKGLDIESITVDGKAAEFSFAENDQLNISHPDITEGNHIIVIAFNSKLSDSMHGIYPCYYEHEGIKKELVATQFESHHAREVFPCIDEPEAKATFDVTLTTETNVTVLGNMPIKNQVVENDKLITSFHKTPVMSCYLLAWVIGEMHKKTAYTKSGVEVNVWATPAQPSVSLDFALDIAVRSIDFFNKYFGVDYPLTKCDHVALPDFGSGAMENWGLITYREIALLADPKSTSIAGKQYIALVIAHELSHQWFGNLVTMKWWNDLWLNESFASLIEYTAVNTIEPDWNIWLDFESYDTISALRRDSLSGVQPVQIDVNHPDEISTLFDGAIVYAKGARLLKMLRRYIGEDTFQAGLKEYFNKFAYQNTEANDLWMSFNEICDKNLASFMKTWISQPGFPVLHVKREGNTISLTQQRLASRGSIVSDVLWPIPLNSNYPEMPEIFNERLITIEVSNNTPIRFNVGNDAHFITHYDDDLLKQLISLLKTSEFSAVDRLQLLNEQCLLASAGIISSADLIPLLGSYADETSEAVWDIICMAIGDLKKFVDINTDAEFKLRAFTKRIAEKQFNRLGWDKKENEPESDTKLRSTIISLMLYSEVPDVISYADNLFKSTDINQLDPELRSLVISSVVRNTSDEKLVKSLLETYSETASCDLKQDINIGLTSTKTAQTISLLLDSIKNTSIVRTQDVARWIAYLVRNKFARKETWQWVRDNWTWIYDTFGTDKSYDDYPRYVAQALSTRQQLKEFKDFFKPLLTDPALTRVINIGINEITDRVDSIERDGESVKQALLNL